MQIKQFEYLVTCADYGSYGKASKILFTTQANVSKVIRQLEDEVGYQIFERSGSGVILTSKGKRLYEKASQILDIIERIEDDSSLHHKDSLLVASNPSNILSRLFVDFVDQYENQPTKQQDYDDGLEQERLYEKALFTEKGTMDVLDDVTKGNADIGFIYIEACGKSILPDLLRKNQLQFTKISDAQLVLSVGRQNPLYYEKNITAKMLREQRYITVCEDSFTRDYHLQKVIKELGLTKNMKEAMQTNSDHVARHALEYTAKVSLSYSFLYKPAWMLDIKEISLGHLLKEDEHKIILGYVKKSDKKLNTLTENFISKVFSVIGTHH